MAITPLTAPYKTLTFDGETAASFGVQILGKGTFNAPKRDVEMIAIPGRSGELVLDKGRFENIEVKYPARLIADSTEDFADAISEFRNFLCSRKGYCRLSDDYNPDEYRMAVYSRGLEADVEVLKAGKFDIVFDCKPQRWLKSGETAVTVASGDTLTNPTLFESSPLLEIEGVGDIEFNGYTVSIESDEIGNLSLSYTESGNSYILGGLNQLNTGDTIRVSGFGFMFRRVYTNKVSNALVVSCTGLDGTVLETRASRIYNQQQTLYQLRNDYTLPDITFNYGTSQTITIVGQVSAVFGIPSGQATYTVGETITITYDGNDTISYSTHRDDSTQVPTFYSYNVHVTDPTVTAYSTKPYDYGTIYCDTDIGEFYRIEGGEYISMNHVGDLGSDLPTLAPGTNTVTFDNTITELNIAPRWWKI